ncbi:MAG: dGTP triphosphohydrolase [Planctomycetota bacterium]
MTAESTPFHPSPAFGLQTIAAREAALLAPYAMRSADSAGRQHAEPDHPYRGLYQRDRDRIVHSSAYRRLSGKTQVFTGNMGDYHRTRLTHTYEVASIARTIGRALRLSEDLIEALALFHDIGHPPFGHAGEDTLNECLRQEGGFSHNRHALTLAQELEERYPEFPGLNLTAEVLAGQSTRADKHGTRAATISPLLEVQVVDLADSATYDAHDTDDAVKLGFTTLDELLDVPLVRDADALVQHRSGQLTGKMRRAAIVHALIEIQVTDILDVARRDLLPRQFESAQAARQADFRLQTSESLGAKKRELERYLFQRVYRHPRVVEVRLQAQTRLQSLFDHFSTRPESLPKKFQIRAQNVGVGRAVGDYLAGMTDRYCDEEYQRLFGGLASDTPV